MKPQTIELTEKLFQLWEDLAEAGELTINNKFTPAYNSAKKEIEELRNAKITKEKLTAIIEKLKKDFDGDNSYHSGVNDGMYHLCNYLIDNHIL